MNRSRFLGGAALAMLVALAVPAYNASAQMQGSNNVTGTYNAQVTGDVFLSGEVHLTQQAGTIVGSAPMKGGGTLHFSGTFTNNKLSGTWRAPSNETGWLTLFFPPDAKGFYGEWGYHGKSPNGSVVATRAEGK